MEAREEARTEVLGSRPAHVVGRRLFVRLAGEIGTKSTRTRRRFLRVLARNARLALEAAGVRGSVRPEWSRLLVNAAHLPAARDVLSRVFGVHSVDEVLEVRFDSLASLVEALTPLYRDRVAGRSFAVRARRQGRHDFTSQDVAVELGAALLPFASRVDLEQPEVTVAVEVVDDRAFAVLDSVPGPGGLPLGSGGRAVVLFSGGFDSPVAAWRVMRRGVRVDLLHCDLGGCGELDQALTVARELALRWAPGVEVRAHVVDLTPVVLELIRRVPPRLRQVLLKRAMYRAASRLAELLGAEAVVTGESLGQVSTQTLRNLAVCEEAATVPVLRPLVGMDKEEIMATARAIGTFAASAAVQEHCSIATGPVETWAALEEVRAAERLPQPDLGPEGRPLAEAEAGDASHPLSEAWIRGAVDRRWVVSLRRWERSGLPEHVVDRVPRDAVVVDVREPHEGPPVGDLRLPFSTALDSLETLDRDRTYVLVCTAGVRSEVLARELRARGYQAYSLAGGLAALPAGA
ncbi:MAG TPA: tRNA uracil 4-sulfurtransferase ThiI [Actinomycetota bacterium]|nr:tRNA uracil 4-sulfurtransferase ThiI [Actinomycetota bacterium]